MTLRDIILTILIGLGLAIFFEKTKGGNAPWIALGVVAVIAIVIEMFFYTRGLVVHYAGHGLGPEQYADVTTIVKGQIRDGKLNFVIDGELFPDDPYKGKKKFLIVKYSFRSRRVKEKIKQDGDRLMLP